MENKIQLNSIYGPFWKKITADTLIIFKLKDKYYVTENYSGINHEDYSESCILLSIKDSDGDGTIPVTLRRSNWAMFYDTKDRFNIDIEKDVIINSENNPFIDFFEVYNIDRPENNHDYFKIGSDECVKNKIAHWCGVG